MTKRIPGPAGHPLLGNLNAMRQDFLQFLVATTREFGTVTQVRAGPSRMILLANPEDIAEVLVKQADVFHKTRSTKKLLAPLLGDGLITLEHDRHRQHRRMMQPAFHTRQVQHYTDSILRLTQTWIQQRTTGETLDIVPALATFMLNIVIETFFSATLAETEQERIALQTFSKALDLRVRSPIPLPRWLPTEHNRILNHAIATLNNVVYRLIAERRQQPGTRYDLLGGLLTEQDAENGQFLSDTEIRDEIATIFFAGYETTTTTLSWLIYLLATHPHVREQLQAEITQTLNGNAPTSETLKAMPFLQQVIKEALRLYPAAWLFDREPIQAVTIGGYNIAAGQTIFISPYVVQRHPDYFAAPDDFLPGRFTPEFEKHLPRFAYFPFGGGPRICIGQPFAQHTIALILATLLPQLTWDILPNQVIRPAAAATLVPANGIHLRIQRL
jgi:cytochrome P450